MMGINTAERSQQSANQQKYTCGNPLYQWHLRAFHQSLYRLLEQTSARRVLDAGCGEGFVAHFLAQHNPDLSITGGSLYKLPFSDNSFDTVLCSEVLEHLEDTTRAVDELKRVTRRYVLLTVPREPYFKWLNDLGRRLGISPDPGHVNFWTKQTFQDFVNGHFPVATFSWKHVYQLALAEV